MPWSSQTKTQEKHDQGHRPQQAPLGNLRYTLHSRLPVDTLLTIKKYPNRRLYDSTSSSYVTLDHVREMILRGEEFEVIDSRTSENVTHNVLLQIIGERETRKGSSMLSNSLLTNLIRFYDDSLQGMLGEYLEKSVCSFINQQQTLRAQMQATIDSNSLIIIDPATPRTTTNNAEKNDIPPNGQPRGQSVDQTNIQAEP